MEALRIEGLRYSYPDGHQALHGVDLRIGVGERIALLGPNGAGKTTLVLHLNGILPAPRIPGAAGSVAVGEQRIDPADRAGLTEIRRKVGIVFQDPDDQLFLPTVAEDVAFGPANLGLRGDELHARVDEALAAVGMLDHRDRAPHHLSLGQRRRVAVATVLAMRPELLVLDEPSSNLDPQARRELAEILLSLGGGEEQRLWPAGAAAIAGAPSFADDPRWPAAAGASTIAGASAIAGAPALADDPRWPTSAGASAIAGAPALAGDPRWPAGAGASTIAGASPIAGASALADDPLWPAGAGAGLGDPGAAPPLSEAAGSRPPVTMLMVTHDLPYALQLCERSVILDEGRIVADGPTRELLANADLLARHRLELPFGFSPHATA